MLYREREIVPEWEGIFNYHKTSKLIMTAVSREPCAVCHELKLELKARRTSSSSRAQTMTELSCAELSWAIIIVKWVNHTKSDNRQSSALSPLPPFPLWSSATICCILFSFILWPQGRCITVDQTVSEPQSDAVNEFSFTLIRYNSTIITASN